MASFHRVQVTGCTFIEKNKVWQYVHLFKCYFQAVFVLCFWVSLQGRRKQKQFLSQTFLHLKWESQKERVSCKSPAIGQIVLSQVGLTHTYASYKKVVNGSISGLLDHQNWHLCCFINRCALRVEQVQLKCAISTAVMFRILPPHP